MNSMTATASPATAPLTAGDRCDRCRAQAYVRVTLQSGSELLFCAHHSLAHREKLLAQGVFIHDETAKLMSP